MRQRLINKTAPEPILSNENLARQSMHKDNVISLKSLLFDSGLNKENWINGLKQHSKTVTATLLNNDIEAFNQYLQNEFGSAGISSDLSAAKSHLPTMDYRPLLQEFLQLAILIEHSTIPPYLTALYSIKDGTNLQASQIILSVAIKEMRHMIMVCNVLNAVNIQPSVNKPENYPVYPMKLPIHADFVVDLEKFSTNSISTFIAIERPSSTMVKAPESDHSTEKTALFSRGMPESTNFWTVESLKEFLQKDVHSIGEFYDVLFFYIVIFQIITFYKTHGRLPELFEELNREGIFTGDPARQIRPEHYYGSDGKLHSVEDLWGVIEVFQEIKGQGVDDMIFNVDPSQFEENVELAHYFRFKEVLHGHFYIGGNYDPFKDNQRMIPVTTRPLGKDFPVDWNATYPMKTNIKLADYQYSLQLYAQAKAFNITYKKLLDTIQVAVEGRAEELQKSVIYMYALKEQAVELMKQPLNGQENAGPTFEYPV